MNKKHLNICLGLIIAVSSFTLSACSIFPKASSLSSIQDFSQSSHTLSDAATYGYKQFNDEFTDVRTKTSILEGKPITRESSRRFLDQKTRGGVRTAAIRQLADYATALEALATKDATSEIKDAAIDIRNNLTALNASINTISPGTSPFSKNDIGIISAAAGVIVDTYIKYKRENAIRNIVKQADPGVQKISQLLEAEFPSLGQVMRSELEAAADDYRNAINTPHEPITMRDKLDFADRAQAAIDKAEKAPGAYNAVAAAARKMGAAHRELAKAAVGGALTTQEFIDAARDLTKQANEARRLFNEIK